MSEKEQLERLYKWYRYHPTHWNLLSFLEKPFEELNESQMNILFQLQENLHHAKLIQKYLENRKLCTIEEQMTIQQLLQTDTITTLINQKITTNEQALAQNLSEKQLSKIKRKPLNERSMFEDYIAILLEKQKKSPRLSLKPHKKCTRKY